MKAWKVLVTLTCIVAVSWLSTAHLVCTVRRPFPHLKESPLSTNQGASALITPGDPETWAARAKHLGLTTSDDEADALLNRVTLGDSSISNALELLSCCANTRAREKLKSLLRGADELRTTAIAIGLCTREEDLYRVEFWRTILLDYGLFPHADVYSRLQAHLATTSNSSQFVVDFPRIGVSLRNAGDFAHELFQIVLHKESNALLAIKIPSGGDYAAERAATRNFVLDVHGNEELRSWLVDEIASEFKYSDLQSLRMVSLQSENDFLFVDLMSVAMELDPSGTFELLRSEFHEVTASRRQAILAIVHDAPGLQEKQLKMLSMAMAKPDNRVLWCLLTYLLNDGTSDEVSRKVLDYSIASGDDACLLRALELASSSDARLFREALEERVRSSSNSELNAKMDQLFDAK